ncbi:hypothetical protein BDM02DRAFT_2523331 [Thelephora ganbajun]|uniref:Uncharacterized protein n=1 Tax=Thelephora ganbajun TaxID=370292 RepID=A0ACB6ZDW6_THEGA|nr:hypothetical protein BDM02DRAFT_2523331 [Thelephora ganbajun]
MPTYFVKLREPTAFSHKEYHEISSTNLLLSSVVPTVHVIPEILDVERFNVALSKALSSFPHLAGRLVRPDTPDAPWKIRLTNSEVPVSLIDSDADEIVPTDLTVQTPLRFVEPLNVAGIVNTEGESDEPLFRLTVTRFTKLNSTSIGACNSHALFDGFGLLIFLKLLSRLYQGLEPIDPPPHYEPEAIKFTEQSETPSAALKIYDLSVPPPWEQPERKAMEFVAFQLTAAQLTEIHNSVTKGVEHLRISRVDTVVGLLARCLSEVEPESKPIDTITYVINVCASVGGSFAAIQLILLQHRGMGIYPENAVVNAIIWLSAGFELPKDVDPRDGVLACATEIRKLLERLKNPEFVKDMAADVAKIQSQVAWDKKGQDLAAAREGSLMVNNLWKFDWTSPDFGHPGKVRFYHGHPPGSRYVKISAPNPKCVDGTWVSREGDMETTFYVPPNQKKRFEESFERYAKSLGMSGSVEFLP